MTEYGKQLREKQILKRVYCLREKQFKKYYTDLSKKGGTFGNLLVGQLESRMDSVVYRAGFAKSRLGARQLVTHGFFLVNGKPVNIPSYILKPGSEVSFKESKVKKYSCQTVREELKGKKGDFPSWLEVNIEDLKIKLINSPREQEANLEAKTQGVVEFYSR